MIALVVETHSAWRVNSENCGPCCAVPGRRDPLKKSFQCDGFDWSSVTTSRFGEPIVDSR